MSRRLMPLVVAVSLMALAPAAAQAAAITGTVSDETTHVGIAGVEVCPTPQPYTFEVDCAFTDASGGYSLDELPAAQYTLYFSAGFNNLPYVSEFFNDKLSNMEADPVSLGSGESRQIDVELAQGGSISGALTDEDSGEPVANMAACAYQATINYQRCSKSDGNGQYQINGLPSAEYFVEYEGWNQANYLNEIYDDAESWGQATPVAVVAPGTTTGIDAELAKGVEILGHVSDVASGAPVAGAMVCAPPESAPDGEINQNCDWTDSEGNYAIRGLPAGRYQVAFEVEFSGGPGDPPVVGQWWKEAGTRAAATTLELAPPQTVASVDGKVSLPFWGPYPLPEQAPPPVTAAAMTPVQRPLPKCKKGFHRKLVKGKKRCVRKRHHRGHPRHHH